MISFIMENLGTILVSLILFLIVTRIIIKMITDKKQGKSSCGCNCADCNMCETHK